MGFWNCGLPSDGHRSYMAFASPPPTLRVPCLAQLMAASRMVGAKHANSHSSHDTATKKDTQKPKRKEEVLDIVAETPRERGRNGLKPRGF